MKEALTELFAHHKALIIFFHVISAVIWVGGMIAMRFAAHHSIIQIEDDSVRLSRSLHALKRLFVIVAPFVLILIVTAVIMAVGLGFRAAALDLNGTVIDKYAMLIYNIVHLKEAIWVVMTLNFIAMVLRRNKAAKALENNDLKSAKSLALIISKYMVPINIVLGLLAIFLGVTLRTAY